MLHVGCVRLGVGSARVFRYQHARIPKRGPNVIGFTLQWNIGFKDRQQEAERDLQYFTLFSCYCKDMKALYMKREIIFLST